jgi:hypothetical protein
MTHKPNVIRELCSLLRVLHIERSGRQEHIHSAWHRLHTQFYASASYFRKNLYIHLCRILCWKYHGCKLRGVNVSSEFYGITMYFSDATPQKQRK